MTTTLSIDALRTALTLTGEHLRISLRVEPDTRRLVLSTPTASITIPVIEPGLAGACTVFGSSLLPKTIKARGTSITLVIGTASVQLAAAGSSWEAEVRPYEAPPWPCIPDTCILTSPAKPLALALARVLPAADHRQVSTLAGIGIITDAAHRVRLVATDGAVLLEAQVPEAQAGQDPAARPVLPAAYVPYIRAVAALDAMATIRVHTGASWCVLDIQSTYISAVVGGVRHGGSYPGYGQALSVTADMPRVTLDRQAVLAALRTICGRKTQDRYLVLTAADGIGTLSLLDQQQGTVRASFPCSDVPRTGINARYLHIILEALTTDQVTFTVCRGWMTEEPGLRALIMPINLPK